MTIGEKIKIARNLKRLTQKQLGVLLGLPDFRIKQYGWKVAKGFGNLTV
ncbi:MAG: hypothetical protein FWC93_00440 [Defluviitaleaceae bacterium]|nr:hypothetical protein [Defluviitaleaceae bacterium]